MARAAVVVVAIMKAKPGREGDAETVFRRAIAATHAEDGCLSYALHRANDDPHTFVLVERWRTQADLDGHFGQPYLGELGKALGDLLAEPPAIVFSTPLPEGDPAKGVL